MNKKEMLSITLSLFDDGGAAAGAENGSPAAQGTDAGAQGDNNGTRADTQRGNTGEQNAPKVIYGKMPETGTGTSAQSTGDNHAAGGENGAEMSEEDIQKEFLGLINGKYKKAFGSETQKIINRRFSETKQMEETIAAQNPIIDVLKTRYGTDDISKLTELVNADDELLREAAERNGMDPAQFREFEKMKRELNERKKAEASRLGKERADRQIAAWQQEADAMKAEYPEFNLAEECKNEAFLALLRGNSSVKNAYIAIHYEELMQKNAQKAAAEAEKRISDNVRANGNRPRENGSSSRGGFINKPDPSKWSDAEMDEVARLVAEGAEIPL